MPKRVCRSCGEERDLEADFYKSPASKDRRIKICKTCFMREAQERPNYYKTFSCGGCGVDYQRKGRFGSLTLCPQCVAKGRICKRCNQLKPLDRFTVSGNGSRYCNEGCFTAFNREQTYGLAAGTAEVVFAQFEELCAICGVTESAGNQKGLVVDHCHASGAIRGLLCRHCNVAIGMFKEDPKLLTAAIAYLKKHKVQAA